MIATGPGWELRCGDYREVLADVERVDAVITDPPYSERTHEGERGLRLGGRDPQCPQSPCPRNAIAYTSIDPEWAGDFARRWAPRCRSWSLICGDDISVRWHLDAWAAQGWSTFAPVGLVKDNPPPRFAGDGPTSALEYVAVSRPPGWPAVRGSRPGWYRALTQTGRNGRASGIVGAKCPLAMRALVRDYSAPGDLICDPCAGGGTTLLAAVMEGRRAIGAELDPATWELAVKRLRKGYTPPLFAPEAPRMEQARLSFGLEEEELCTHRRQGGGR